MISTLVFRSVLLCFVSIVLSEYRHDGSFSLQLRGNDLAGLTDLKRVVDKSSINSSTRGSNYSHVNHNTTRLGWAHRDDFPSLTDSVAKTKVPLTGSTDLVSQLVKHAKVLATLHATTSRDNAGGAIKLRAV
jgi:hypothetical protein